MIYTVTFSPAIDYILELDEFKLGEINRTTKEKVMPGGKGINVSIVLKNLGYPSVACGFVAGFVGSYLVEALNQKGIKTAFIEVEGLTRINVKIEKPCETAINAVGPAINEENIKVLFEQLRKCGKGDIITFCGAFPSKLKGEEYHKLLEDLNASGVEFIVDTTKENLLSGLKYHPLLVKPNKEELEELFNIKINTEQELLKYAKQLVELGAKNVIVSLGGDGALFVNKEQSIRATSPKGKVINTVGAGDSLVAGFLGEYIESKDLVKAFYKGMSAGSASAFSQNLASKEEAEKIYQYYGGK